MRLSYWLSAPLLVSAACASNVVDSPELGSQKAALSCDGLASWSPQSFAAGARVQHKGRTFECKVPGWCAQAAYEPGGTPVWPTAWLEAWTELESCGVEVDRCDALQPFVLGQRYLPGTRVTNLGNIYECTTWPESDHCGQTGYEPGQGQAWDLSWSLVTDCAPDEPEPDLTITAYYLRPSDLPYRQEYYDAMVQAVTTAQEWYREQLGFTFRVEYKSVVGSDLLTMRCGSEPSEECASDVTQRPYFWNSMLEPIGGWNELESKLVFAQGAGSISLTNVIQRHAGVSVVGDWVLEPISGVREPAGEHCDMGIGFLFCPQAEGLVANRLGTLFGLLRPSGLVDPQTIMADWWEDYPDMGLLAHEKQILALSPHFGAELYDPSAPFVYPENDDVVTQGALYEIRGEGLEGATAVEFVDATQTVLVDPTYASSGAVRVQVPAVGLGYLRVYTADQVSNVLPLNVLPE
jgi:hypothetical protein